MIRPASGFGRLFCKMRDELRNSRTVHNRLSSQLLYRVMDFRDWTELKLAEMSGILPSVVSAHLCGERPIRPQHLAAYLGVLDRQERVAFLDAWLRDNMDYEAIANLLDGTKTRSMSSVQENQCRMLDWWATAIAHDSTFAKILTRFSTKAGFKFPSVLLLPVSTALFNCKAGCWARLLVFGMSCDPCAFALSMPRLPSLLFFWLCASRAR